MFMSTTGGRLKHVGAGEVWSVSDAAELYEVPRWGKGYFSVSSAGSVQVHPTKEPSRAIDLKQLADDLQARGINLPLLKETGAGCDAWAVSFIGRQAGRGRE
jgi:arginine decarboxylase-like protein